MKFLAIEYERAGNRVETEKALFRDEARRVWELQQSGVLREIYFHAEEHTAILALECANSDEAQALLATLPLVKAGLIDFKIIPLAPYDGFNRLFAGVSIGEQE